MPITVTRRDFLQRSMALAAVAALPGGVMGAIEPAPISSAIDHFALLSDVHVSGGLNSGMAKRLSTAVTQVLAAKPQKVLVCGDCAYLSGHAGDYQEYTRRVQPLVGAGLPIHMTLGNHDKRDHFWNALPREQPDAKVAIRRQAMVVKGVNANWFLLDSLVEDDKESGEVGRNQLEWLTAELDALADKPALIMVHHDLVRKGKPGALKDAEKLLAITRPRRQVKALFWGHTHVWGVTQDTSGIHMVNLPATGYTLWMRSFLGWVDCRIHRDHAHLTIHAIDAKKKENGLTVPLKWRAA